MFCVIQKIPIKKVPSGEPREILVTELEWTTNGVTHVQYGYKMSNSYFERPHKVAYRISIHRSYRVNGKVHKKQTAICTIGYYSIVDWGGWYRDYIRDATLKDKLAVLGISNEELDNMICEKFDPIIEKVQAEFQSTEEYAAREEHKRILNTYRQSISEFVKKYECKESDYEEIYDVFGSLRNPKRLKEIQDQYQSKKEYERRSREKSRGYYENFFNNYTGSSYGGFSGSTYDESDKVILKQFYRTLSKKYHPDANPDRDTAAEMQLLNRIKAEWNV